MLPVNMASGAPARAQGAPAMAQDSLSGGGDAAATDAALPAQALALELAPAPGAMSMPQASFIPAELVVKSPAQLLMAEAGGPDGSLRASLARMMAAEQRWPAAALPTENLAALATGDPDALKAFVDGQPSSAVAAAGTLTVMSPSTQTDGSPLQSDLATPSADGSSPNGGSPGKRRGPRSSTSKFRGVSCYKRTGRWESHIWSNGKQVHLGSFRAPEEAASAYDKAAIMFRGWDAETNAPTECYRDDEVLAFHMQNDTTEEYIQWLRRGCKELTGPVTPKPVASLSHATDCPSPASQRKASRTSVRNSPGGNGNGAAAAASVASFGAGILPSIPLMDMRNAPLTSAALEDHHLLLGSVTAPLHGDGIATLVHAGTPSDGSALLCNGYGYDCAYVLSGPQTHTSAGVPLASLVAEGSAAAGGGEAGGETADQSFAEFATSVWGPAKLGLE